MNKKIASVLCLDGVLLLLALAVRPLSRWMMRNVPTCPVAAAGLQCPACGSTRCVRYFFSGEFLVSFSMNPAVFLLIVYLGAALILLNVGALMKADRLEKIARAMTGWRAVIIWAIAFVLFGVVRNFM